MLAAVSGTRRMPEEVTLLQSLSHSAGVFCLSFLVYRIYLDLVVFRGGSGTSQMGAMGATIPAREPGATICS